MKDTHVDTEKNAQEKHPAYTRSLKQRISLGISLPLWVLAGFIAASFAVGLLIEMLVGTGILQLDSIKESVFNATFAAVVYSLALGIVIGIPAKWLNFRTTKEELGLTRLPNWKDILYAPLSFIVYTVLAGVLLVAVTQLFPSFDAEEAQNVGFTGISQYYEYILAFITLVVIAPIAEEVLVRGFLYGKLRAIMPVIAATIVTSLLFSLMHFQWNVALNVLPLGIVLVVLREMTGSIWAGILLHMIKNGLAFYLLFINPSLLTTIGG